MRRSRPAEAAWRILEPCLPALGITRVADVTGLDDAGLPVAVAVRPDARLLAAAQGKGETLLDARLSAALESAELWHAERPRPADRRGRFSEIPGALDPSLLPAGPLRRDDPRELDLEWLEARELMNDRPSYVPRAALDLDTASEPGPHAGVFDPSSNGLASGSSWDEAVLQGLCEAVERDAAARFASLAPAEAERRRLDLSTVRGRSAEWLARLSRAGLSIAAWDMTSTAGLPAFRARLRATDPFRWSWAAYGLGAAPSAETALWRALSEAAQTRLTIIAGSRDDVFPSFYRRELSAGAPGAEPDGTLPMPAERGEGAPAEELARLLERLRGEGAAEVHAVDLGRGAPAAAAEFGRSFRVARVLVPALAFDPVAMEAF